MNDHNPPDDDIASLLRLGLDDDLQEHEPARHRQSWEPPDIESVQRALPQYEISAFIARGGMGVVYRGTQPELERAVAIKLLPGGVNAHDDDGQLAARFKLEAKAMARLTHPNIVAVHEAGETPDGWLYFVMEFIEGTDLGQIIASEGLVQPQRAFEITSAVCAALAFAHDEGIIHRDIKPSNILLDRKGRVKVADFGLARMTNPDHALQTRTDMAVGTSDFMAPETLLKGTQVDQRADIYAVGVMLYQMLTGQIPRGKFSAPSSVAPEVDKRLDAIVDKALQTNREQRYSTATEMKTDVDAVRTPLEKAESKSSRRRVTTMAAACLILVSAGVLYLWQKVNSTPAGRIPAADGLKPVATLPEATPTAVVPAQPGEIVTFAGHSYLFVPGNVSWTAAKAGAEKMGGHLATVTTKEESTWLKKTFDAFMATEPNKNCWLGGYAENKTAPWRWITGEPFDFQDWDVLEPNYDYGPESPAPPPYGIHLHRKERWHSSWLESPVRFNRIAGYIVEWDTAQEPAKAEAAPRPQVPLSPALTAATKDAPFVNTLGMKFVPVPITGGPTSGQRVLLSVWDTRVQDYASFAPETKRDWPKPEFEQGSTHPAVMVSWDDATAFCAWLTERERKAGKLGANERYRLPSDHEWSCGVGIGGREDATMLPVQNDKKLGDIFPWASTWPPPDRTGNYQSEELHDPLAAGRYGWVVSHDLPGYHDGFAGTSPVESFAANRFGLHDMGGNIWQWCEDWYDAEHKERVLRGASWVNGTAGSLRSSYRNHYPTDERRHHCGFRCVLAGLVSPITQVDG